MRRTRSVVLSLCMMVLSVWGAALLGGVEQGSATSPEVRQTHIVRLPTEGSPPPPVSSAERDELIQQAVKQQWLYVNDPQRYRPDPVITQNANGQIAYIGIDKHVYLINPDGSGRFWVTPTFRNQAALVLAWSRDSKYLGFVTESPNGSCLHIFNAEDASILQQALCGFEQMWSLSWAPDNQHIAFFGNVAEGDLKAWVVSADGRELIDIAPDLPQTWRPAWLDADTVVTPGALSAERTGMKLFRVDITAPTVAEPLTPEFTCSGCNCGAGDWVGVPELSPDGSVLAFLGGRTEGGKLSCRSYYGLYVMPPAGGSPAKLADVSATGLAGMLAWSPDNARIGVYGGDDSGTLRLNLITTAGERSIFTNHVGSFTYNNFTWAPDGTRLVVGNDPRNGQDGIAIIDPARPDDYTQVTLGSRPAWSSVPLRDATVRALRAVRIEITQGIQNEENSVPLVAGKTTWVRVFAQGLAEDTPGVDALLTVVKDGQTHLLTAVNRRRTITAREPDRTRVDSSFNFLLPAELTAAGTLEFRAEVAPYTQFTEKDYADNKIPRADVPAITATFHGRETLEIYSYRFRITSPQSTTVHSVTHEASIPNLGMVYATYPLAETAIDVFNRGEIEISMNPSEVNTEAGWGRLLAQLRERCDDITAQTQGAAVRCHGWVPETFQPVVATYFGYADHPVSASTGGTRTNGNQVFDGLAAHELGHTFGLSHPSSTCNTITHYGFTGDAVNQFVKPPTYTDFMHNTTNCGLLRSTQWITEGAFRTLYNHAELSPEIAGDAELAATEQAAVTASGVIALDGAVETITLYTALQRLVPGGGPAEGRYRLELRDAQGAVLVSRFIDSGGEPAGEPAQATLFNETLPYPDGAATLVLAEGDRTLKEWRRSAAIPQGQIMTPVAGETFTQTFLLEWIASDADNDSLTAVVDFSADNGTTWKSIGLVTDGSALTVDPNFLQSTTSGRFRLQLSDGLNSSLAFGDGSFATGPFSPTVSIVMPADGARIQPGFIINVVGFAYDDQGVPLAGDRLVWKLDGETEVGRGEQISLRDLKFGRHVLSLTATDDRNRFTTATISFTITEDAISGSSPGRTFLPTVQR